MKRILVDGLFIEPNMKGVGYYTWNVLQRLPIVDAENEYFVLVRPEAALLELPQDARFHYIRVQARNHYWHGLVTLPRASARLRVQAAWIPYETTIGLMPCRYTLVCHDVQSLIEEAQTRGGKRQGVSRQALTRLDAHLVRSSLVRAAAVFCNSEFVGDWLRRTLHIPSSRVRYAPCAPAADFEALARDADTAAVRASLRCPRGYVLAIYTGDERENLSSVLLVFDRLAAAGTPLNLVIAGLRTPGSRSVQSQVAAFSWRSRVRLLPFLPHNQVLELAKIYAAATIYLDLSLHEGFGMQVVEAMSCGTPVVCSKRGALPEVAGNAALLVDPDCVEQIASQVNRILCEPGLASSLRIKGQEQARKYDWRNTAGVIAGCVAQC